MPETPVPQANPVPPQNPPSNLGLHTSGQFSMRAPEAPNQPADPLNKTINYETGHISAPAQPVPEQPAPEQPNQINAPIMPFNFPPDLQTKSSRRPLRLILILILILFVLIVGAGATAVAAAYEKIIIPNEQVQDFVSYQVLNLPFMPKTTKYVLTKTALTHETLSSAYINASIATESNSIKDLFGIGDFDLKIEGPVDFNDKKSPKLNLNFKLTKEFDGDVILLDNILYGKINKLPTLAYTYFGSIPEPGSNPFLNKWVSYDISPLETDARKALEENQDQKDTSADTIVEDKMEALVKSKILPLIEMSEDTYENKPAYKLTLNLEQKDLEMLETDINHIFGNGVMNDTNAVSKNELSAIKNMTFEFWIDKTAYQLEKAQLLFTIYSSTYKDSLKVLGAQTMIDTKEADSVDFAMTVTLNDLGRDFSSSVKKPEKSITFEEFMMQIEDYYQSLQQEEEAPADDSEGFSAPQTNRPQAQVTPKNSKPSEDDADGFATQ